MPQSNIIRLMLVDDHPVMRAGLANLLVLEKDFEVVAQSDDGESVVSLWQKHKPDVCLLDISMHGIDGIEAGHVHGKTDDLGFNVAEDPVHVHDLNATLLHLLGFDHTRLTYRFQGRDYRLTDVHGHLVPGLIA